MKRFLAIGGLLLLPALAASAYEWRLGAGTNVLVLPAGEAVSQESLWVGYRLDVLGRAARDLWLVATTQVRFEGEAQEDVRILAGSAVVGGEVRRNLAAYAPNGLQLATNSAVRGELLLVGGSAICEGTVEGDAWILADSATLGGQWLGNVRIQAREIRLVPGTRIGGDLTYTAPKTLIVDPGVSIGGTLHRQTGVAPETPFASRLAIHGYLFVAALLVGMPFVGFFPGLAGGAVRNLRTSPWRALFAGAAALFLGPFLIAFALMTVVGIPLGLLLGALFAGVVYLAHVVVALWLGHRLLRSPLPQTFARVLSSLAVGLFLLYFAAALPGVAPFLVLPAAILGTGALVLAMGRRPVFPYPLPPPVPPPLNPLPPPPQKPE